MGGGAARRGPVVMEDGLPRFSSSLLTLACLLSALMVGADRIRAQAPDPMANAVQRGDAAKPRGVEDYWSAGRILKAAPVRPGRIAAPPSARTRAVGAGADKAEAPPAGPGGGSRGAFRPFGHLFVSLRGEDRVCAAQFVAPALLITTAQCVRDNGTGDWGSRLQFCQGLSEGTCAARYDVPCFTTKQGWVSEGADRFAYDYAFLKTSAAGKEGHFGYLPDAAGAGNWFAVAGYDEHRVLDLVRGNRGKGLAGLLELQDIPPGKLLSGAGWVGDFDGQTRHVISVTSFALEAEPTTIYGPALDAQALDLLAFTERECR